MSQQQAQQKNKKAKTAITPTREDDFPEWYQQVIKAADMAENAPVRGCMIIKPYGYAIWELIQKIFDGMIKDHGVENAYFPLLIPLSYISKEAEHVDGFAKECAVVTHHRLEEAEGGGLKPAGKLAEPLIIRPTSETIIGESFAKWINSYRDLPMKLNQWCNVMRWEMRPRLFLRTSEFLWQEGHNAFATAEEAEEDARKMVEAYRKFNEDYLAIPLIVGEKTAEERFPGAVATYTIEAIMQDGKALQAATSHNLGQTFSKSADISFQDQDGQNKYAWTTSWGSTTRLIGALVMVHADDDGLVLPPKIAPQQVVILPISRGEENAELIAFCQKIEADLRKKGIRVKLDNSDAKTPDKMWKTIKQGVPVRVEIGQREMDEGKLTFVPRDLGRDGKQLVDADQFVDDIESILDRIQQSIFDRAKTRMLGHIKTTESLAELRQIFEAGEAVQVLIPTDLTKEPEYEAIQNDFSVTSRCMPFAENGEKVLVGKAY
jgi:prolyl-tRNA synthetase